MRVFGLLGQSLQHSYSPMLHHLMAEYSYELFEVPPEKLAHFFQTKAFQGINVTIPYKKAVIPFCDEISDEANIIGSVNTILRRADGTLYGDNTDAYGFLRMIQRSGLLIKGKKVLVLGSGGASLTVCHVLREQQAREVIVISRSGRDNYDTLETHADADIIVNTTPVGMYPNVGKSPIDLSLFPQVTGILELIYNPARTKLALMAKERGILYETGLSMLVGQAKKAVEIFTGRAISDEEEDRVLATIREHMQNVVLIGMPSCGKSMVGALLAELMGKQFVDADEVLVQQAAMSIPEIFETEGEAGFRRRETLVLDELGKESGLVIATGGGCVTKEENEPLLRQNGLIVWLERDIEALVTDGRPISQKTNIQDLYDTRRPLYKQFADVRVLNDGDAFEVAKTIREAVHESISH